MKLVRFLRSAAVSALLLAPLAAPALANAAPAAASAPAVQTIDRGRFTVEVTGSGPDVILIPGLASSRAVYDAITPELAKHYRVHRVQIAGFAGLPAGPNASGPVVQPFVEALAVYIKEQHLDHPAVIGHSLGGFSALVLAQQHPELVSRVLVVDAAPFFSALTNPAATEATAKPQAEQFSAMVRGMSDAQFAQGQDRTAAFLIKTPAARPAMIDWSIHTDRNVMAQATYDIMTTDARPGLAAMTTPVTVLYAWDATMGVPAETYAATWASLYTGLPGVKLVRVDGSYHFIMFDQPQRFAAEVETFLK